MAESLNPTVPTPTWSFSNAAASSSRQLTPQAAQPDLASSSSEESAHGDSVQSSEEDPSQTRRRYPPRTCRICLDEVEPTFETPNLSTQYLGGKPRVRYVSDDPELGRLMRPCKCKGSQQHVHEGCLRAWRAASPSDRNLWQCPTCRYEYRLSSLRWSRWLNSGILRAFLTATIMAFALFLLGFVADPIINIWMDPAGAVVDVVRGGLDGFEDILEYYPDDEPDTWFVHFSKGLLSLGLVGLVKVFLGLGPLHWFNIRLGGTRRGRGRDRLENVSWLLVAVGVATFMGAVWKGVSAACARYLSQVSDDIIDVPEEKDEEDEGEDQGQQAESKKDQ
ncbi:RING finger domain-containing protein [Diaporthe helianthi]|uniref:RING finger domain-containing protein n=1 Tax=Diaporthe helianthi TaxID=158607 RepID=A0A2P5HV07_DIAHE|nr:RING finger domain-containing protein [Diaporthe helianthi]